MTQPHPFGGALDAEDVEAMMATLSPEVVFHGRAVRRPIVGRADVIRFLEAIVATFQVFTQEFRDGLIPPATDRATTPARTAASRSPRPG